MSCVPSRLAAALFLAGIVAALSTAHLAAQESASTPDDSSEPQLFHPEVRRLPPIEEEVTAEEPLAPRAEEAEEVVALPEAQDAAEEPSPPADEQEEQNEPKAGAEKRSTFFDVDLFPAPDQLLIKGEEALEKVEEIGTSEAWLVRPLQLWSASFEFGISGSSGNSETMDMRLASHVRRETDRRRLTGDVNYKIVTRNGKKNTDRLFVESRHEWLIKDIPWTPYVHGTAEHDRMRKFGARVNVDGGFGYEFYKTEIASLLGRVGLGVSTEFESPNEEVVYEAVYGLDYERKVTARQRLAASVEYYPELEEFGNYRLNFKASWAVNIDREGSLSLKLSVTDRYDSTPNPGVLPNDLDYAATLLWSF